MNGYRKELKYIVSDDVFADMRNRIEGFMRSDEHQNGDHYGVRSIYFDSPALSCFAENLAGISTREKYRIRRYDCVDDVIVAEIKIRHRDTISKMSTLIDRELYDVLVSGDHHGAVNALMRQVGQRAQGIRGPEDPDRVLEKYLARIMNEMYAPSCMVDYERSAYVYDIGNVRITFDRNITASREYDRMFDDKLTGIPALPRNTHILEIKYDEFLPDEIKTVLGGMDLVRSSSSKYVMCRALLP